MKTATPVRYALVTLILATASPARTDDSTNANLVPTTRSGAILSGALGASHAGIMGAASAQIRRGTRLLGFRLAASSELNIFGPSPSSSVTEFGLLYGRYSARKAGYVTATAGISMVRSVSRGRFLSNDCDSTELFGCMFAITRYEKLVSQTIGVPFEARAVLAGRSAGIGIGLFGNLNTQSSFIGVGLTLDIGLLR